MLFSVDRLQIMNDQFIAFEFFDVTSYRRLHSFHNQKLRFLKERSFCDVYYGIAYDEKRNIFRVKKINYRKDTAQEKTFSNFEDYKVWFKKINGVTPQNKSSSKTLQGAKRDNSVGDAYVQRILNEIHAFDFPCTDFSYDDNGLGITIKSLDNEPTFGFDFDLYEPYTKVVVEFLKRENEHVTNLTAHPFRYPWNRQKFISLGKYVEYLNGSLYLINYSDNDHENIAVIKVLDLDCTNGEIRSDIGYKLENRNELLEWLKILNTDPEKALEYLSSKPCEIRDESFWYSPVKSKIGKKYILVGED